MNKKSLKKAYELFHCRRDLYAVCWYDKKSKRYAYKSVKEPFTLKILEKHMTDDSFSIGIYPLLENNTTRWISADFDFHSKEERDETLSGLARMEELAEEVNLNFYMEKSKSGNGIHIWIFFDDEIESWKARRLMGGFLLASQCDSLSSMDRFFPSQDRLYETSKGYGNLIHMPFSKQFISKGTWFEINKSKYGCSDDDLALCLSEIEGHSSEYVDALLDKWDLLKSVDASAIYETDSIEYEYAVDGILSVRNDPFVNWCADNPQKVCYNSWIAMITNLLPFGEEGHKVIHQLSSLDAQRYNKRATHQKILACQGMKPITYNWIYKNTQFDLEADVSYKSPAVAGIKSKNIASPVYEKHGRYFIFGSRKSGDKELSTWTAEPMQIVKIGDQISRVWNIIAEDKIIKGISFDANDLSSLPAFKRKIMSLYHKLLWYGTENDLMRVLDYLNQHYPKLPSVIGIDSIGMINDSKNNWVVITQLASWDKEKPRDDYMFFNPSAKKEITYSPTCSISKEELKEIRKSLFSFNALHICATIMGWMCSLFIKQRLYESHSVRFPVLMIHGQAGSGKSETARHIIQQFFGDMSPMLRVDDITSFAFTSLGSSTNMFPLVYDEYKPALFDNSKIKMISKMIRGLYDNESSMRGQKDLTTREFKIFAPAVIIGESGFEEPALRERSADVFFSKQESVQFLNNFIALSKLPLSKLGNALLNWSLKLSDDELFEIFSSNIKDSGRVHHNIAMLNSGLDLLEKFYESNGIPLPLGSAKDLVRETQLDSITISGETRSAVDNILEGIFVMQQSGLLTKDKLLFNSDETEVYLHTPTIYPLFKRWARDTSFDFEIISHNEFIKQLKRMDYYLDMRNVRMGSDDIGDEKFQRKVRVLDVERLEKKRIIE